MTRRGFKVRRLHNNCLTRRDMHRPHRQSGSLGAPHWSGDDTQLTHSTSQRDAWAPKHTLKVSKRVLPSYKTPESPNHFMPQGVAPTKSVPTPHSHVDQPLSEDSHLRDNNLYYRSAGMTAAQETTPAQVCSVISYRKTLPLFIVSIVCVIQISVY